LMELTRPQTFSIDLSCLSHRHHVSTRLGPTRAPGAGQGWPVRVGKQDLAKQDLAKQDLAKQDLAKQDLAARQCPGPWEPGHKAGAELGLGGA